MLFPFPPIVTRLRAVVPPETGVYLVGGTVRDAFLNRRSHDIDLAVPRGGIRLARRIANALGGAFYPLDAERDVGRAIVNADDDRYAIDVAAFRGGSLETDLRARDFTINAMAASLHQPEDLIDPLDGLSDLKDKVLRACAETAFADDALRILRGARLAASLGFRILPETRRLMHTALPLLEDVSPERLRDELFRMLESAKPAAALKVADALGALAYVLPELPRLRGVPLPPPYQADAWQHTMRTVEHLAALLEALSPAYEQEKAADFALGYAMVRIGRYREALADHLRAHSHPERSARALLLLAALYHRAGQREGGDVAAASARLAGRRGEALRLSNAEARRLAATVRHWPQVQALAGQLPVSPREVFRYYRATGDAGVEAVLLALAETVAAYGPRLPHDLWQQHLEAARTLLAAWWERHDEVVAPPPLLSGHDLMQTLGVAPGPQLGALLEGLLEAQAAGEITTREEALAWVKKRL